MNRLMYIQCSPRGERSHSTAVAEAFLEEYRKANPKDEIRLFNVFNEDLPPFDGHSVQAKYNIIHGMEHSPEDRKAWDKVVALIEEFKSFDKYLFSVPMWNWNIPYRLKQYLDILLQSGFSFTYDENGREVGLVHGKAFIVYARGNAYPKGSFREHWNFQAPYLEFILETTMDIKVVDTVAVEGTLLDPKAREKNKAAAVAKAREVVKTF